MTSPTIQFTMKNIQCPNCGGLTCSTCDPLCEHCGEEILQDSQLITCPVKQNLYKPDGSLLIKEVK